MKKSSWDKYHYTRYKPIGDQWGEIDLNRYKQWYATWFEYMCRYVQFIPGKSALEVGAGIGPMASILYDHGLSVSASDISKDIVKQASRLHHGAIPFFHLDIEQEASKDKFDYILALEVLEHISEPKMAMKNIRSMLTRGGHFIATTPYPYKKNYSDTTHVHVHKPEVWRQWLVETGFKHVETYPLSCFPYLWRIHPKLNVIIPVFVPFPYFISTTLVIATI